MKSYLLVLDDWMGLFLGLFPPTIGRCIGLIVSTPDSKSSGSGSSPDRGHFVVFLGKTFNSHSASLHPGVHV